MTDSQANESSRTGDVINRRQFVASLSVAGAATLAGCNTGDDGGGGDGESDGGTEGSGGDGETGADGTTSGGGGGQELGERVGEVPLEVFGGLSATNRMGQVSQHIRDVLQEEFGVESSVSTKEFLTMDGEIAQDNRARNLHVTYNPSFPTFLEPQPLLMSYHIRGAGANPVLNPAQYANCEYSTLVEEAQRTADQDDRRATIHEAMSVMSEDLVPIKLTSRVARGAYRTDQVEIPDSGEMGITDYNVEMLWEASTAGADSKIMSISPASIGGVAYQATSYLALWSNLVYSPLAYYDKNHTLQPGLAQDWTVEDESTRFTFELREDATFHNGDPVTAEDVVWTYEWINNNYDVLDIAEQWPYQSLEAVDEHTVRFTFEESVAPFLRGHVPLWGILPSDIWIEANAEENPQDPDINPNEIVGSGPYEVDTFTPEELLALVPNDDHWIDAQDDMVFQAFQDTVSARRAFLEGEINMIAELRGSDIDTITNQLPDNSETSVTPSFLDWRLMPQVNFGATKFREFRMALSQAIDRTLINEILEFGGGEPHLYSAPVGQAHPFYPDNPDEVLTKTADSAGQNLETAKQILRDAGWGWDDDGNLHYPPDADLDPLWSEGESPMDYPDQWPCVEELGLVSEEG